MSQKCLVVGGSGFIGSNLVAHLLEHGFSVRVFDRTLPQVVDTQSSRASDVLEFVAGDFLSLDDVNQAMDGCDYCVHLVTTTMPQSSNENMIFDIETNLIGAIGLLNAAVNHKLKKFIFLSSGGTVYGSPEYLPIDENHATNPMSSYGVTKLAIEKYMALYNTLYSLDSVVLRLANPYGEGQRAGGSQGAVAAFINKSITGEVVEIWGDGSIIRDYIYIDDVSEAIISAIESKSSCKVFNIGTGVGSSLLDIIKIIEQQTGLNVKTKHHPTRSFDVPANVLDISLSHKELCWQPKISLSEGVLRTFNWMNNAPTLKQ